MFDDKVKSQPKLVYSRGSNNESKGDTDVKSPSSPKIIQTVSSITGSKNGDVQKENSQIQETQLRIHNIQEQTQAQETDKQQMRQLFRRQETPKQDQPTQPKQIDADYTFQKESIKSNIFVQNDILQTSSKKVPAIRETEPNIKSQLNKTSLQEDKDKFNKSQVEDLQTQNKVQIKKEESGIVKKAVSVWSTGRTVEPVSKVSLPTMSLRPPLLNRINTNNADSSKRYDSLDNNSAVPKQVYVKSVIQTLSKQTPQEKIEQTPINLQEQEKDIIETKKHVTAIKIHKATPVQLQKSPLAAETKHALLPSQAIRPLSHPSVPPILSPSAKDFEEKIQSYHFENLEQPFASQTTYAVATASTPKSILKNALNIDQTDAAASSLPAVVPEIYAEERPVFFSNSKIADYKGTLSRKETSIDKGKPEEILKAKSVSPSLQTKRHATTETAVKHMSLKKDGKMRKKCVRFNSEVQLHLDSEESTVQALSVDA